MFETGGDFIRGVESHLLTGDVILGKVRADLDDETSGVAVWPFGVYTSVNVSCWRFALYISALETRRSQQRGDLERAGWIDLQPRTGASAGPRHCPRCHHPFKKTLLACPLLLWNAINPITTGRSPERPLERVGLSRYVFSNARGTSDGIHEGDRPATYVAPWLRLLT